MKNVEAAQGWKLVNVETTSIKELHPSEVTVRQEVHVHAEK